MSEDAHVVIVGGGFGGLYAARALARAPFRVTLLDCKNHHTFQPLLYQVATAGLTPSDIAAPIRRILRHQKNVTVLLAEALTVDVDGRRVLLRDGDAIGYDHLIVATGATHSYFGHPEWASVAPGLKTVEDALEMRKRIFFAFEAAERAEDPALHQEWLTFVLIGGGPTGVELAGTLAEIAAKTLAKDFRRIDPRDARVILVEAAPTLLGAYVPELREKARLQLERLGVEVRLSTRVTAVDAGGVMLGDDRLAARTVLWAAGVAASPLVRSLGAPLDRAGRVQVEADLTVPGHPEIYVIGDAATLLQDGEPIPGVARAAIDGGRHAAAEILRGHRGEPRRPFHFDNPGMLATIGRGAAIADFGRIKLSGFVAWMAWLLVHILFLIGFRNRFAVLVEWAVAYLTYDRGARLITGKLPDAPATEPAAAHDGAALRPPTPKRAAAGPVTTGPNARRDES
jgi:NADH:ubiquinone reductase (H+-translocating)